jgi:hypothetical protein
MKSREYGTETRLQSWRPAAKMDQMDRHFSAKRYDRPPGYFKGLITAMAPMRLPARPRRGIYIRIKESRTASASPNYDL